MSDDLIAQLEACAVKLGQQADELQQHIKAKHNKNKYYVTILSGVGEVTTQAKDRVELAKALLRASNKKPKESKDTKEAKGGEGKTTEGSASKAEPA